MAMSAGNSGGEDAKSCRFYMVLIAAICEWSLIVLLLINAAVAYLATALARLCKLPAPCLLCSRLDHIIGSEKKGFYRNLFCRAHKVEISSLVYCHGHRRLADFREICEVCLRSSATIRRTNPEACRLLGGNLLTNLEEDADSCYPFDGEYRDELALLNKVLDQAPDIRQCTCCLETFNHHRLLQAKKKLEGGIFSQVQQRKRTEKPQSSSTADSSETETSDSESEVQFSEDGDGYVGVSVTKGIKKESVRRRRLPPSISKKNKDSTTIVLEDIVPEKLIHPTHFAPEHSLADTAIKPVNEVDSWDKSTFKSTAATGYVEVKNNLEQVPRAVAAETSGSDSALAATDVEIGKASPSTRIISQLVNDPVSALRSLTDHNDSFKNALANKGIIVSPRFSELISGKESSRPQDELKLRLSRAFDLSDATASPRGEDFRISDASSAMALQNIAKRLSVERSISSLEAFDANLALDVEGETCVERLKQQVELDRKSISALYKELEEERNASAVAANEAMAMITRLQEEKSTMQMEALQCLRMMEEQAEYDQEAIQKLNNLLTEREKELLDLEAELESYSKRLREAALEEKFRKSVLVSQARDSPICTPRRIRSELSELSPATTPRHIISESTEQSVAITPRMRSLGRSMSEKNNMMPQECTDYGVKDLLLSFEEDKAQISACLKKLQKKFLLISAKQGRPQLGNNALQNGQQSESTVGSRTSENWNSSIANLENNQNGAEKLPENGWPPSTKYSDNEANTILDDQLNSAEVHATTSKSASDSHKNRKNMLDNASMDMNSLKEEVSQLVEKTEALNADREFLGHALNALKYGPEGIQLIREIACQLKELRCVQFSTAREQIVA